GNTTVRNVRAYQDRGLLPPPERRGRTGIYTASHLARLRMISGLLDRGYTLASIGELLQAWEHGHDISQLLGLESALTMPWSDEVPVYYTLPELAAKFGEHMTEDAVALVMELGIVEVEKDRLKVPSPRLLHVGLELAQVGIPLGDTLAILKLLRSNVETAANEIVGRVAHYAFDSRYGKSLPPAEDVPQLAELIWRLRPLVDMAVGAEVSRSMQKALTTLLGDRLTAILEHLNTTHPGPGAR
ncbi:MAG: MerR family transcriptional regulator, partial [Gammaproteobacteria bacterium]|nr:MerR family transcriptional regulator [Gammaproteobacteria bacterium]